MGGRCFCLRLPTVNRSREMHAFSGSNAIGSTSSARNRPPQALLRCPYTLAAGAPVTKHLKTQAKGHTRHILNDQGGQVRQTPRQGRQAPASSAKSDNQLILAAKMGRDKPQPHFGHCRLFRMSSTHYPPPPPLPFISLESGRARVHTRPRTQAGDE